MYVICRPIFVVQNSCAVHPGWTIHRMHDYYHCERPCQVCRCGEETAVKHVEKLRIKDSYEVCPIMQHGAATCSKLGCPGVHPGTHKSRTTFVSCPTRFSLVFCRKVWWYLNRQQNFTVQVKCSTWLERRRMHFIIYDNFLRDAYLVLSCNNRLFAARSTVLYLIALLHFASFVDAKCVLLTRVYVSLSVCVSVCLSLATYPHYCTDPHVTWGNCGGALVVHYWADLQSVYGFRIVAMTT